MRKYATMIFPALIVLVLLTVNVPAQQRGIRIIAKSGESLYLYKDYHALVVGVSDYEKWPDLSNAVKDAKEVASELRAIGFKVELLLDPTSRQLKSALSATAFRIGSERNRAVLFYFAGHGETMKLADGTELGYIIPRDCPLQSQDPMGFDDRAISMRDIEILALKIVSKHVLMVFDSCFSGSLFSMVRSAPVDISEKSARPVRQFITAGRAEEEVPDRSIFKTVFLQGIKGDADLNNDGYVTGSELGMHLQDKVVNYSRGAQHPQYGKINNPKLDRGDFIFSLGASSVAPIAQPSLTETKVNLSLRCNVSGARVLIDSREMGTTPLPRLALSPGQHTISVQKKGYDPYTMRTHLYRGQPMSLDIGLNQQRPRKGRLFVKTEPEKAKVRILNIRPKFYQGMELAPGKYHVEVSARGYKKKTRWVDLGAGKDQHIDLRLKHLKSRAAVIRQPVKGRKTGVQKINLDFVDTDVTVIFKYMAEALDLNIVWRPSAHGRRITIKFDHVPWDEALKMIMKVSGLACEIQGNVVQVFAKRKR